MVRKCFIALIVIFCLFSNCKHQEKNDLDSECISIIESFFHQTEIGSYTNALDSLLLSNRNIDFSDSATVKLREGFKTINELSGKYINFNLLKKRIVKNDIAIYAYLVKFEKKFYRYEFIFYKPRNSTVIYKFAYDDILDLELEESIKLYTE